MVFLITENLPDEFLSFLVILRVCFFSLNVVVILRYPLILKIHSWLTYGRDTPITHGSLPCVGRGILVGDVYVSASVVTLNPGYCHSNTLGFAF